MSDAAGHQRVPKEYLETLPLPLPLPPFEKQKRIVAVLDGAFEGLDGARMRREFNTLASHASTVLAEDPYSRHHQLTNFGVKLVNVSGAYLFNGPTAHQAASGLDYNVTSSWSYSS